MARSSWPACCLLLCYMLTNLQQSLFFMKQDNRSSDEASFRASMASFMGNLFTSTDLQRIALNFVLAGRDTSFVALSWFFWLVMNHPDIELKIIDEISRVLRNTRGPYTKKWMEEPLTFDEADKLIYLKAAAPETLR
ncbi:hypothetical protein Gotur_000719 [Gossypium turneri]